MTLFPPQQRGDTCTTENTTPARKESIQLCAEFSKNPDVEIQPHQSFCFLPSRQPDHSTRPGPNPNCRPPEFEVSNFKARKIPNPKTARPTVLQKRAFGRQKEKEAYLPRWFRIEQGSLARSTISNSRRQSRSRRSTASFCAEAAPPLPGSLPHSDMREEETQLVRGNQMKGY